MPLFSIQSFAALLAATFIAQAGADCPSVGAKFYITAKLQGGQNGHYAYADEYGPHFSFTEDQADGDQFYLDKQGHLHDAKQAANALAQAINSVDRVTPPFVIDFYSPDQYDAPAVCAFQPQANGGCNLGCTLAVTNGAGTDILANLYTCLGCGARRHRCVWFDYSSPTQPKSSDLKCKPVKLGVQAV